MVSYLRASILSGLVVLPALSGWAQTTILATNGTSPASTSVLRRITDGGDTTFVQLTVSQFFMTRTGGDWVGQLMANDPTDTFLAFCSEPKESLATDGTYTIGALETTNTLQGGISVEKADLIRELFARHHPVFATTLTPVQAGALQTAIWEIIRETERVGDASTSLVLNVSSGNIQFQDTSGGAGVVAQAQTYLNALTGGPSAPKSTGLRALTSIGNQDIVVMLIDPVPEPASAALVLGAFGLLVSFGRRPSREA